MKYLNLLLLVILLNSCHKNKFAELTGTTRGFTSGTLIVKDQNGQTKFTGNIEDGKFDFKIKADTTGYYSMRIINLSAVDSRIPGYDIYLEPGTYNIVARIEAAHRYPAITSSSAIQTSLSQYYNIANMVDSATANALEKCAGIINDRASSTKDISKAHADRMKLFMDRDRNMIEALHKYVDEYPQNKVEAHILAGLAYETYPDESYPVYQKFTAEQKKSVEGAEIGDKLNGLMKLAPGQTGPQIAGNTIDGKLFSQQMVKGKITLIEFWTADSQVSKSNHRELSSSFSPLKTLPNFAVVSVSMDTDAKAWKAEAPVISPNWINVSDLKGEDSPNSKNWQVTQIPSYMLLDGNWKIIKRNLNFGELNDAVQAYIDQNKAK